MTSCGIFQAQGPGDFRDGGGLRWGWEALKIRHFIATYFSPTMHKETEAQEGTLSTQSSFWFFFLPQETKIPKLCDPKMENSAAS